MIQELLIENAIDQNSNKTVIDAVLIFEDLYKDVDEVQRHLLHAQEIFGANVNPSVIVLGNKKVISGELGEEKS